MGDLEWVSPRAISESSCLTAFFSPFRRLKSGVLKAVAPSGLANVPDSDMPLCPHAHNAFREISSCRMECYRETKRGQARWVLCARQHNCIFKGNSFLLISTTLSNTIYAVIFPTNPTQYVQSSSSTSSASSHGCNHNSRSFETILSVCI